MKISANVLVLNEHDNIKGLINNLVDANVDEIIVLDGGSTDGTFEYLMAQEMTLKSLKVFRWPQKLNTEYKAGFQEKERRNFMMSVSSSDYILYIDADERIDVNFKEKLTYDRDIYAVTRIHFWNKRIRVNMKNDLVWSPESQYRIVRRSCGIKYKSNDVNGLHNFLSKHGIKIFNNYSYSRIRRCIAPWINKLNNIVVGKTDIKIYHMHYYDIKNSLGKKNDLRAADFKRADKLVHNSIGGGRFDYHTDFICCVRECEEEEKLILKYR